MGSSWEAALLQSGVAVLDPTPPPGYARGSTGVRGAVEAPTPPPNDDAPEQSTAGGLPGDTVTPPSPGAR